MKKCLILSLSIHAVVFALVSFLVCPWLDKKSHNVRATIVLDEASPVDNYAQPDSARVAQSRPPSEPSSKPRSAAAPAATLAVSANAVVAVDSASQSAPEISVPPASPETNDALSTPIRFVDFNGQERSTQLGGYVRAVQQAGLGNEPPVYPRLSRLRGESGRVVVEVVLSSSGDMERDRTSEIQSIFVAQSSGFEMLDQSALRAVKRWKFPGFVVAATNGVGTAQLIRIRIPILFDLESLD